jgi:hypothetical protein
VMMNTASGLIVDSAPRVAGMGQCPQSPCQLQSDTLPAMTRPCWKPKIVGKHVCHLQYIAVAHHDLFCCMFFFS